MSTASELVRQARLHKAGPPGRRATPPTQETQARLACALFAVAAVVLTWCS